MTGVYIDHPLHPPSREPIATPFTISGTIGGCISHFPGENARSWEVKVVAIGSQEGGCKGWSI